MGESTALRLDEAVRYLSHAPEVREATACIDAASEEELEALRADLTYALAHKRAEAAVIEAAIAAKQPRPAPTFEIFQRPPRSGGGPLQRRVLALLEEKPHRYLEICHALNISTGHTSNLLNRMVKVGLIQRESRGLYRKADRPT